MVMPENYHVHCFDVVARPGFLQARPTFEAVSVEQTPQPTIQEKQIKESQENTTKPVLTVSEATSNTKFPTSISEEALQPTLTTNEEVEVLKEQIDKLAKVLEKVVDDVYEAEEVEEQPTEPTNESKAALIGALGLLSNSNISEGLFEQIVEIIKKSKEKK
jgi:vancomycin resistance protein YoaR